MWLREQTKSARSPTAMQPLKNTVILYDADCPLCRVYTGAFVRGGFLEKDGRVPFQTAPGDAMAHLDTRRAQDEIALLNAETGEVRYGIDSLLCILGHRFSIVGKVGALQPIRWALTKLYRFISYNRKVIAAVAPTPGTRACQPSFSLRYRVAYLLLAWMFTAGILTAYGALLGELLPAGGFAREAAVAGGQLVFQGAVIAAVARAKSWEYLGHLMTVSVIGALLLIPVLAAHRVIGDAPLLYTGYFLCVAAFMLWEHARRVKLLGVTGWMSATWVLYRIVVLTLLLTATS